MSNVEAVFNTLMSVDRGRNQAWIDLALCAWEDPDIWFPNKVKTHLPKNARGTYAEQVNRAVEICNDCPVQAECLADAESRDEQHGIWGGKDFSGLILYPQGQPEAKAS